MVSPLRQYIDDISTFDEVETRLISFSSTPVRSESDDVAELVDSIREHGLLEPIIVRPRSKRFEVVAGNRRLRACKQLKQRRVRCMVTDLDDAAAYEVSLVENVQRKTLSPLEEAAAFKVYCTKGGWGSQTKLAQRVGKSQEYVSHRMRLLDLPEKARLALQTGKITPTAAQELAWIEDGASVETALEMLQTEKQNTKAIRRLGKEIVPEDKDAGSDTFIRPSKPEDDQKKLLKESILILRISLVRLDGIISKVKDEELKKQLLSKRLILHNIVDDLIHAKGKNVDGLSDNTEAPLLLGRR
jgi:ParB family chromosome partitioning protein